MGYIKRIRTDIIQAFDMYKEDEVEFVYSHPIAGREKIGIEYSDKAIFHNANFVITPTKENTSEGLGLIQVLAAQMGFKNITMIPDVEHDEIISYTSQLTHAIAISLVNSNDDKYDTKLFIGDSYYKKNEFTNAIGYLQKHANEAKSLSVN